MIYFNYSTFERAWQELTHAVECDRIVTIKRLNRVWVVGELER